MEEKKFREIIQFAIEKETGTHDLYTMCGQIAKYSGAKELFGELAREEERHRKREKLLRQSLNWFLI